MNNTALLLVDLQNDFIHAEGTYGRAGQGNAAIAALPAKLKPLVDLVRGRGGIVIATLFTLVPGRGGEPIISPHLRSLRPFLGKGDFAPGSWGQQLVDELAPADFTVEKLAYSAFYMTRLEWICARWRSSKSMSLELSPTVVSPRPCATRMFASLTSRCWKTVARRSRLRSIAPRSRACVRSLRFRVLPKRPKTSRRDECAADNKVGCRPAV